METEPYITTTEDLDKFLEEMETEVTPPVTPKNSNKVCQSYIIKILYSMIMIIGIKFYIF